MMQQQPIGITADEAMQRLVDGNERFLRGEARFLRVTPQTLAGLAKGQQIRESPEGQTRLAEGRMKMIGAIYEIETGRVRFLMD